MRFLLIGSQAVLLHPAKENLRHISCRRHGIQASCCRNDGVASRRIKAKHGSLCRSAYRQAGFVSIVERFRHTLYRRHFHIQVTNPAETILHLLSLGFQCCCIVHVAAAASAASGPGWAVRRAPIRGRRCDLSRHLAEGEPRLYLHQAHRCGFPRQQAGDKHRHALRPSHAFHICPHGICRQGQLIILAHNSSA